MPQVSKIPLKPQIEKRITELLWKAVVSLNDIPKVEKFFLDLLSPNEKLMLSKRLSVALLRMKGYDYRSIRDILKVSTSTVRSIDLWLKNAGEGYKMVVERLLKEEAWKKLLDDIGRYYYRASSPYRVFKPETALKARLRQLEKQ